MGFFQTKKLNLVDACEQVGPGRWRAGARDSQDSPCDTGTAGTFPLQMGLPDWGHPSAPGEKLSFQPSC